MNGQIVMLLVAAVAIVLPCAWLAFRKRGTKLMANTNVAPTAGMYEFGRKSFAAGAAITRYYVVIEGADAAHVLKGASATELPMGIAEDEAEAAEDQIRIALIPGATGTLKAIAAAAITKGALIQSNGDGKVKTGVATGYAIGRALTAASGDGDTIEFAPLWTGVALA